MPTEELTVGVGIVMEMALNTNGVCDFCAGRVRNAPGHRKTIERLTEIHSESCPGLARRTNQPTTKGKS